MANSLLKIASGRMADRSALRGTAFGIYYTVIGLGALLASVVFGAVWSAYSASGAFGLGAGLALLATLALFLVVPRGTATEV